MKKQKITERVDWGYYDRFEPIMNLYLPDSGEGDTLATETVTAINRLIFKWYNDGDVYDNVNSSMEGWANDLSDQANWLAENIDGASDILNRIFHLTFNDESGYEDILKALADECLEMSFLRELNKQPKSGSIYNCKGSFEFAIPDPDEYEEYDEYEDVDEEMFEENKEVKTEAVLKDNEVLKTVSNYDELKAAIDNLHDDELITDDEYDDIFDFIYDRDEAVSNYIEEREKVTNTNHEDICGIILDNVEADIVKIISYVDNGTSLEEGKEMKAETSDRDIEGMKDALRAKKRQALIDAGDSNIEDLTRLNTRLPEEVYANIREEQEIIRTIDMIHSILTYADHWDLDTVMSNKYIQSYIQNLGRAKVEELAKQEIDYFEKHAKIQRDVYTDNEGCSYNSVKFIETANETIKISEDELKARYDEFINEVAPEKKDMSYEDFKTAYLRDTVIDGKHLELESSKITESVEETDTEAIAEESKQATDLELETANTNIDVLIASETAAISTYDTFLAQCKPTLSEGLYEVLQKEIEEIRLDEEAHIEKLTKIKEAFHLEA